MGFKAPLGSALGVDTIFHAQSDGTFVIEERFDAEPTIETNRALFNDSTKSFKGDINHHIASIPLPIYWDLEKQGIVRDRKRFLKWLMDRDNRAFLVKDAKLA